VYLFPIVAAGEYALEAESSGFKLERRSGLVVEVNQNARVDFVLQVGSIQETVEVKGDAPLVDTFDVQLGETVDQERIENLPLNGRNVYDLIGLMPGAVDVTTAVSGTNDSNNMSVNGNRVRGVIGDGTGVAYAIYNNSSARMALRENDVLGNAAAGSIGLRCVDANASAKDNTINGFATAISLCSDDGGNAVIP